RDGDPRRQQSARSRDRRAGWKKYARGKDRPALDARRICRLARSGLRPSVRDRRTPMAAAGFAARRAGLAPRLSQGRCGIEPRARRDRAIAARLRHPPRRGALAVMSVRALETASIDVRPFRLRLASPLRTARATYEYRDVFLVTARDGDLI